MFQIIKNSRISREARGFSFETKWPNPAEEVSLEDGLKRIARLAILYCDSPVAAELPYDALKIGGKVEAVVWEDGSKSWAFPRWSFWKGQCHLNVNSACGSTILTVRFDVAEVVNALK
jgi:hypothetical protein